MHSAALTGLVIIPMILNAVSSREEITQFRTPGVKPGDGMVPQILDFLVKHPYLLNPVLAGLPADGAEGQSLHPGTMDNEPSGLSSPLCSACKVSQVVQK